jgi:hypothetical protein
MTPDPNNSPPPLNQKAPAAAPTPLPTPVDTAPLDGEEEEEVTVSEKKDYGALLVKNKWYVIGAVLLLFFGGFGFWIMSLEKEQANQAPPSPVASEIKDLTQAPKPAETVDPMTATEESLNRDKVTQEEPSPDVMLADGSATAPSGDGPPSKEARDGYNAQMTLAARANNTDSMTVTSRDKHTGQFVQRRVPVQRVPVSTGPAYSGGRPLGSGRRNYYTGPTNGGFSGVTPQNQSGFNQQQQAQQPPRPRYDTDGVPFETNDEINMMIANLPDEVKATYEKMSGKRYRPLPAGMQQQSSGKDRRTEMAYIPGMDGFNTIRFRGQNAGQEEETEVPDIFYRCSIQGNQVVKTGSVVMLRLTEDATFNGITFPRNMLFSALASVDANRVNLIIDRMGPHRVKVQTYNYAYMPGIMIDPGKRAPAPGGSSIGSTLQQSSTQELSNAIAQSQQAANSWQGIGGRMAVTLLGRMPRAGQKLREVALPDGYPLLLSKTNLGPQQGGGGLQQGGANTAGGMMGQEGNPFQSLLMSGQGLGGYQGNSGVVPPMYYPAQGAVQQAVQQAQQVAPQVGQQVGRALGGRY